MANPTSVKLSVPTATESCMEAFSVARSFAVPITGIVTGEPRCINRNQGTSRVRGERHLGKVMDQRGKKSGGYPCQKLLQGREMRDDLQIEEVTDLRHETDEIDDIAIGRREMRFEEKERHEVLLRIRMARESMGVATKRKPMDVSMGGMKKPDRPVR